MKFKDVISESSIMTDIMQLSDEEQAEIIAQYEAIRKDGQFNMMNFLSVQRAAFENGYYALVNFVQNSRRAYVSILKNYGKLIKKVGKLPVYRKLKVTYGLE